MFRQYLPIVVLCLAGWQSVMAEQFPVGQITIDEPWARALPTVSKNGATYFKLSNSGTTADRLVSVETPQAAKSQIHTHVMENNVAKMRHVPTVEIAAGETVIFEPGKGFHVMMMGLNEPLVTGNSFAMVLTFEKAGSVSIKVDVLKQ